MEIIDKNNLIPDHKVINRVVKRHPFSSDLWTQIKKVSVKSKKKADIGGPSIEFDHATHEVILYVFPNMAEKSNYEYILYHEFGHVADRLNPEFGYSDQIKYSLSDTEQVILMELWNLYIDARLQHHNLFRLDKKERPTHSMINGKLQELPCTIQGKLMRHVSFIESRGIVEAERIVKQIWENPEKSISYQDIISIVTTGCYPPHIQFSKSIKKAKK
jgi:hypothetical protein